MIIIYYNNNNNNNNNSTNANANETVQRFQPLLF